MSDFSTESISIECRAGDAVGHGLREIVIVPDGRVQSKNGTMVMDREGAELVIKEFEQHATPLPIDVDHQTLGGKYAAPNGRAPAAAWIESLFYEPGRGLVGMVNWTDEGRDLVRSQKYRFLSPVAIIRKADRRVVGLHSAALTNKPAIPQMETLAAAEVPEGDEDATESVTPDQWLDRIVELLRKRGYKLEEAASREAVLKAVVEALEGKDGGQVASSLQANAASPEDDALLTIAKRLKAKGVEFPEKPTRLDVLQAVLKALEGTDEAPAEDEAPSENAETLTLRDELASMKAAEAEREVEELIQPHVASNKLNPNNEAVMASARKLARDDPETFEALMAGVTPYAEPGLTKPPPGRVRALGSQAAAGSLPTRFGSSTERTTWRGSPISMRLSISRYAMKACRGLQTASWRRLYKVS